MPLDRTFFLTAETVTTLTKQGGVPLSTVLFSVSAFLPFGVQFSAKVVFSFLTEVGFLSAFG